MTELKSCPFCGSINCFLAFRIEYAFGESEPYIYCGDCKAEVFAEIDRRYLNIDEYRKYRIEKTIETWNRRVSNEEEDR